ncbi:MAG: hypothetical protein ACPGVP_07895 [Thiolinea sp.]
MKYLLCALLVFSCTTPYAQNPANKIAAKHADKAQATETIIRKQLALLNQDNDFIKPLLLKNHGVPIRNPFTKLPQQTIAAFAKQGIDLKTMSGWKALYVAGHLTGALGKKIVNTDPKTIMVIGTDTSTHEGIYSRGPVVLTGEVFIMSEIYGKDLVWYGEIARHLGSDPDIGLPKVISDNRWPAFNLGISPYPFVEELQAIKKLGKAKTHREQLPKAPQKTADHVAAIETNDLKSPIIIPDLADVENRSADKARCEYYASSAVEQHKTNLQNGCGYSGSRWNNDKTGQMQWCLQTAEHITNAETDARSKQLQACFRKKTDPNNPQNRPALPQACHDPKKLFRAVKNIDHAYRYENTIKQPVANGLIRYDYNGDNKPDYIFLEVNQNAARVMTCFSNDKAYQRRSSDINFRADGDSTRGYEYQLIQRGDQLLLGISYFGHNEGSSWRKTAYQYQTATRGFKVVSNQAGVHPVSYDGQPYPMGSPETPQIIRPQ